VAKKKIKKVRKTKSKLTKTQIAKLEVIYQNSIDEFDSYWESAREENDPNFIVDQIMDQYGDEIAKFCKCTYNKLDDKYDFGPRDWLYENADAGIN
jgi:hypothetical protein